MCTLQRQHGLLIGAQGHSVCFTFNCDTGSLQRSPSPGKLREDAITSISPDSFANVSESGARGILDILHFLLRAFGITVHQLSCQFRLERDERKSMTEHIM